MNSFTDRYHNSVAEEQKQMLQVVGCDSIGELIEHLIPSELRLRRSMGIDKHILSEHQAVRKIKEAAYKNTISRSFIGMGYYPNQQLHGISSQLLLSSLNQAITPQNSPFLQGSLEALYNFQSMVCSLSGMDVATCSPTDEGGAAAQAMEMMYNLRSLEAIEESRNILFVDQNIYPQTLELLLTHAEPLGIEIVCDNFREYEFTGSEFGAIVQYPAANGEVNDYDDFSAAAHGHQILLTAIVDLLSLSILEAPARWGADIVVAGVQRLGLAMGFGGTHAGFVATQSRLQKELSGTVIERTNDNTLQIVGADVEISAAQTLSAIISSLYVIYNGAHGLIEKALHAHTYTLSLANALREMGCSIETKNIFDTLEISNIRAERVRSEAEKNGINFYYPDEHRVHISLDELTTIEELNNILSIFAKATGAKAHTIKSIEKQVDLPRNLQRRSTPLQQSIFNSYCGDMELREYIRGLERSNLRCAGRAMSSSKAIASLASFEFSESHPFAPKEQSEGYSAMIEALEHDLAAIAGLDACSLQPNSQSNSLYTSLMVIRAYYQSRNQGYRNVVLIPSVSTPNIERVAVAAGMKVVRVECQQGREVNINDFNTKAEIYSSELCCVILTAPSESGLLDPHIREIIETMHDNGAQVAIDGTNIASIIGISSMGYIGADTCTINIKGSDIYPMATAHHLSPFLPTHPIVATGGKEGITATCSTPFGNPMQMAALYIYIKMAGEDGLRHETEKAILNANYIAASLRGDYNIASPVANRVAIEFDKSTDREQIIEQLIDYGTTDYIATSSRENVLLIEPTEAAFKSEIDRFIETMISIKQTQKQT